LTVVRVRGVVRRHTFYERLSFKSHSTIGTVLLLLLRHELTREYSDECDNCERQ
jgi:hypothetical protein